MRKPWFSLHENDISANEQKNDKTMKGPMWSQMLASEAPERFAAKQAKQTATRQSPKRQKK